MQISGYFLQRPGKNMARPMGKRPYSVSATASNDTYISQSSQKSKDVNRSEIYQIKPDVGRTVWLLLLRRLDHIRLTFFLAILPGFDLDRSFYWPLFKSHEHKFQVWGLTWNFIVPIFSLDYFLILTIRFLFCYSLLFYYYCCYYSYI